MGYLWRSTKFDLFKLAPFKASFFYFSPKNYLQYLIYFHYKIIPEYSIDIDKFVLYYNAIR